MVFDKDKIKKYCVEKIEDEEMERFNDYISKQTSGLYCYVARKEDAAMRRAAAEYAMRNHLSLRELDADVVDEIIDLGIHEYLKRHNGKLKE